MAVVKGSEVATIDTVLVTVQTYEDGADEIIFDTANQVEVTVETETEDAVKLIVKGRLIAQKPPVVTVTGNTIVLTDNVFNDKLVEILQGGTVLRNAITGELEGYKPPVAGSGEKGKLFKLNVYSAIYNEAGILTGYEKIIYPNCQGTPFAFSSEDGTFRASDYTINSAPANGESPYEMYIVQDIPHVLEELTVTSEAGVSEGKTKITVSPSITVGNSYMYKTAATVTLPNYNDVISSGYTEWNGTDEITATTGNQIVIVEVDDEDKAKKAGIATVASNTQ